MLISTKIKRAISSIAGICLFVGFCSASQAATIRGKVIPANANALIKAISPDKSYETRSDKDGKFSIRNLPASCYDLQIQAKGYATDWSISSVQLTKNQTSKDFKIFLKKPGSISGRISPFPQEGTVLAKNRITKFAEAGLVNKDGTYKVEGLAPGVYDLIILARGYQRVIGIGPLPSPNTLSSDDKKKIMDVFSKADEACEKKDVNAMLRCLSAKYKDDTQDIKGMRESYKTIFDGIENYSVIRQIDVIAGISGKKAIIVNRVLDKSKYKPKIKINDWERKRDTWVELSYESGNWKITRIDDAQVVASFRHASDLPIAYPMEGEPDDIIWRYSGDTAVSSVEVKSGVDNGGHDYTLIPLKK